MSDGVERHVVDESGDVLRDDRLEELALAPEVRVDQLLVRLGRRRDPVDAGARDAVSGELRGGRVEDPLSCLLGASRHGSPWNVAAWARRRPPGPT